MGPPTLQWRESSILLEFYKRVRMRAERVYHYIRPQRPYVSETFKKFDGFYFFGDNGI